MPFGSTQQSGPGHPLSQALELIHLSATAMPGQHTQLWCYRAIEGGTDVWQSDKWTKENQWWQVWWSPHPDRHHAWYATPGAKWVFKGWELLDHDGFYFKRGAKEEKCFGLSPQHK